MPRTPSFKVRKTPKGWLLNIPASISDTSKLQRRYFPTRDEALEEAKRLREGYRANGEAASVLPPRVAGDAYAAWMILEPRGKSLIEAARFLIAHLDAEAASVPIRQALEAYHHLKSDQSPGQVRINRLMKTALEAHFEDRSMISVSTGEIVDFLTGITDAPASYNQWVRVVGAFWRWAAKEPRKWCNEEIVKHLERKEISSSEIGVLFHAGAERVLRAAENHYPDMVPAISLWLFTGIRRKELERLQPEDVTAQGVTVTAANAKTKRRRFIQMNEPLAAWLKAHPIQETILPSNWRRKERAIRRLAGFAIWTEYVVPNKPPDDLLPWPENAFRHTAATVMLAIGKPIERLVFEHGHTGGLATLQRHYIGVMPRSEAFKIWKLRPLKAPASGARRSEIKARDQREVNRETSPTAAPKKAPRTRRR